MTTWGWLKNRVARLRAWLRIADFFLRAEGKRLLVRIFSRASLHDAAQFAEFEKVSEAMAQADWAVLRPLAEADADFPNRPDPMTGLPWFHTAIELGAPDVIDWMIAQGAELNFYDGQGLSPLCYAILRDEDVAETIDQLVRAGADVDRTDVIGCTALHVAAAAGSMPAVQALLRAGANPVAFNTDTGPKTPVHLAEQAGHVDVATALKVAAGSIRPE